MMLTQSGGNQETDKNKLCVWSLSVTCRCDADMQHGMGRPPIDHAVAAAEVPLQDRVNIGGREGSKEINWQDQK